MLVELVLDAGDDGIIGFEVFPTIEVLRCFREVSFAQSTTKSIGAFLLRGSTGSSTSIASALLVTFVQNNDSKSIIYDYKDNKMKQ